MSSTIPQGYTVVQLDDKRWYPLEVTRDSNIYDLDGTLYLHPCHTWTPFKGNEYISFQYRDEAVVYCRQAAREQEERERCRWEEITAKSDLYPERCIHYVDLITEITGKAPFISRGYSGTAVSVRSWYCSCGVFHMGVWFDRTLTIEDALEAIANTVYASYQTCQCSYVEQEQAMIAI